MATAQELDELTQHIRKILPDQKAMSNLRTNPQANVVEFTWHARHFVVRPTLDVFELKGQTLLITGASMLIQAALRTKDKNTKVIEAVIETLHAAEDNMRGNPDRGLALLSEIKKTLSKLAGK
ncbi:MAG: hypothetical protein HYY23_06305 [Verrucomicrobia bacterium]|nr:hypothetical protein [Verrucomicrobiota bacterium]